MIHVWQGPKYVCYPFLSFESDAVLEDGRFKLQSILRNQPTDLSLCLYKQSETAMNEILSYLYNDVKMDIGYIQKFQEISMFQFKVIESNFHDPFNGWRFQNTYILKQACNWKLNVCLNVNGFLVDTRCCRVKVPLKSNSLSVNR